LGKLPTDGAHELIRNFAKIDFDFAGKNSARTTFIFEEGKNDFLNRKFSFSE